MTRTTLCILATFCCGITACTGAGSSPNEANLGQIGQALTSGTWTSIDLLPEMGDTPGNVALLTTGEVFVSGPTWSNSWWRLSTNAAFDGWLGYWNAPWTPMSSSILGRYSNPAFIAKDGRYWEAGGENTADGPLNKDNRNQAEIYDPVKDSWSPLPNDPFHLGLEDAPATLLADGSTIVAGPTRYCYCEWQFDLTTSTWTPAAGPGSGQSDEGGSVLLPDGRVFGGSHRFSIYQPSDGSQVSTAPTTPATDAFVAREGELGAMLLLPSGKVLVLGSNSHNGIYSPADDAWETGRDGVVGMVADTPGGLNHSDTSAVVEPNGRVLAVCTDPGITDGTGSSTLYEYSPDDDVWISVPTIPGLGAAGNVRMLAVPEPNDSAGVGLVMVTGGGGKAWFYKPDSSTPPSDSWRPSVSSAWTAFGTFHVRGTQLNGLTTGADIGDDGKMATNYPIAWVEDVNDPYNTAFLTRTFNFDQMAPRPSTEGVFSFTIPEAYPGWANGTWHVHVAANGLEASNTVDLTVTDDRGWGFIPVLQL